MDGILLIDKPKGWTSHDVVAKVRNVLRQTVKAEQSVTNSNSPSRSSPLKASLPKVKVKVGHTGTLDPLATGLLVLVLGNYTKKAGEFSKLDKTYEVTMRLGATSTTGDTEGPITPLSKIKPTELSIKNAIAHFIDRAEFDYKQVPPAYSAVKIAGQRAYKLARAGRAVKLESRKVKIYEITDVQYAYPEVRFTAKVSSGTYIRSLVEDIGANLGTGAYMSNLNRTQVGEFDIKKSISIESLSADAIQSYKNILKS